MPDKCLGKCIALSERMRAIAIVPTYNERENLERLVPQLLQISGLHVLIVDDQSPDGTGALADALACQDERVSVLHRHGPRGLGRAYLDGIRTALATDADVICQMDADLSHRPSDLQRLLQSLGSNDLAIGSRYVAGGTVVDWPLRRRLLSRAANAYVRTICALGVHDCTSGFRVWRRRALEQIPLDRIDSDGYAFLVNLLWEAVRVGCRVAEVPIAFIERRQGTSKLGLSVCIESAILPWRLTVRRFAPSPRPAVRLAKNRPN